MARNYMMRSEKRESTLQTQRAPVEKQARKRRRSGPGFLYSFCMFFLLLLLWPFGLLMLWRRKVRWNGGMKLLVSIVTLAACILIYGFALTVNTGSESYTAIQDAANNALDVSADWLIQAGKTVGEKSAEVYAGAKDLTGALLEKGGRALPDALEKGVEIAEDARVKFVDLANKVGWKLELPEEADVKPTPDPEPSTASANHPAQEQVEVRANKSDARLPIYIPSQTTAAGDGKPIRSGKLKRGLPTPTPKPTRLPTPAPTEAPEASPAATEEPASEN